jgi:hypothetical protein
MIALGFRVKSGAAIAVVLKGPAESPSAIGRHVVELCDPDIIETRQPYHSGFGKAEEDAKTIALRVSIIERATARAVAALLDPHGPSGQSGQSGGFAGCRTAGLVVGSVIDPASVANPHIRAHASEGRLFRTVLETALAAHGVATVVVVEKQLADTAHERLQRNAADIKRTIDAFGKVLGSPWRSDEKAAATAAWMALKG